MFGTEISTYLKKLAYANIHIVKVLSFEFSPLKMLDVGNEWPG